MPPKLNPLEAIKQSKGAKTVMSLADQVRAEMAAEKAATRARGMLVAGEEFADPMNPSNIMKMSEALGNAGAEGKTLKVTQADRSRVFGPNKGGTGFSGMQLTSKPHQQARSTWGVGKQSHQTRLSNATDDNTIWSTFIGSPTQHMSNPVTVQRMYEEFNKAKPSAGLVQKMNEALNNATHPKTGKLIFPDGIDISNPSELTKATTFDQRKLVAKAMTIGGEKKGEKATQEAFKVIREETDPLLADSPTYAVGNRLFTIDKNSGIYRPDLNSAFPYITTGDDMGLLFKPAPVEQALPTFVKRFEGRLDKNLKPTPMGHKDLTATTPTEFIDEAYLTNLQKQGNAKGGLIQMAKGGAMRGMKKLKGIYGEVEASMGRGKGAEFEQTASPLNIIKETGGNWSPSGDMVYKSRLDRELENLQKGQYNPTSESLKLMLENAVKNGDTRQIEVLTENLRNTIGNEALNKYVTSNLKNYVTKQMATEADPVRKLAEQGIKAFPVNIDEFGDAELRTYGSAQAKQNRKNTGYVPEGVAKSPLAKHYETMTDESISMQPAKEYQRMQNLPKMQRPAGTTDSPWLLKLDPDTPIFSLNRDVDFDKLGFTHMMDVLREDVAAGRIRPEQLSKITIEQAVRRTHDYDETLKANMLNARIAEQANANVFKEYPEGYRWVQLDQPGQFALESDIMGHSVRGYEPPKGHSEHIDISGDEGSLTYGHGGWEAVKSGRAKIYSLRDPKGQSHATVEVGQLDKHPIGYGMSGAEEFPKDFRYEQGNITPEQHQQIYQRAKQLFNPKSGKDIGSHRMDVFQQAADEVIGKPPEQITQVKGKQNAAPNEEYLPYVQDFVRSGQYSDVGDLGNTGLYKADPDELGMFIPSDPRLKNLPGRRADDLRKAKEAGLFGDKKYLTRNEWEDILRKQIESESGPLPPAEGMARGGLAYMGKGGAAKGAKAVMSLADQVRAEMAAEKAGAKAPKKLFLGEDVASQAIGKAAKSAGMNAPVTANKPLTTAQDFHTSLGDSIRERMARDQALMDSFNYKYDKGQRVFTEDSARKNWPPMTILSRALEGNRTMREDPKDFLSKKIIDEVTGKPKRTPPAPGYRVRLEHSPDNWSEFLIPESAIKGNVDMARGGLAYMGKGGAPKGVKKVMSLADQVRAEMAMEKGVLPAAEREANLGKFLTKSQVKEPVFHAAKTDVKKFSPKHRTELSSMGHHFGTAEQANFRTGQYDFGSETPNIGKYHLNIENPLEVSHMASYAPDHLAEQLMDMNLLTPERYDALSAKRGYDSIALGDELTKVLQKNGYDGLKYANDKEGEGFSFVPLGPTQIKSAIGNRGTYDINDPDITKAHGGLTSLKRKVA